MDDGDECGLRYLHGTIVVDVSLVWLLCCFEVEQRRRLYESLNHFELSAVSLLVSPEQRIQAFK